MPTIKDVARYTGLSIATISKYLNGGNVLEHNRASIEEAVRALDYRINRHAQSLKTNRTKTIGVVMPTLSIPFFGSMYSALDRVLREAGYTCFAASYDFDRELELDKLRVCQQRRRRHGPRRRPCPVRISPVLNAANRDTGDPRRPHGVRFAVRQHRHRQPNATYGAVEYLVTQDTSASASSTGRCVSTAYERLVGYRRVLKDYVSSDERRARGRIR